jgi:predicted nuclease of restriction endonuclease-like (RecB) superfamily
MSEPPWSRFEALVEGLIRLQGEAQVRAGQAVGQILTLRSWLIGTWIVGYEQGGHDRARYGERLLDALAQAFRAQGVRGLGVSNLRNFRQLAWTWPRLGANAAWIRQTSGESLALAQPGNVPPDPPWRDDAWMARLRTELSFSHLLELSRVASPLALSFYELQTLRHRWSVRELRRQRDSLLFERVGLSKDEAAVMALAEEGRLTDSPHAELRDPYVLEFLGLEGRTAWSEGDLEQALLQHLEAFLLELGREYCFVGRQYRITVGGRHHFLDLLFFHRRLRCLVAVELKLNAFGHEDAGQMNFYLNWLRENAALPDENPPIGIILCADKDAAEVRYALGGLDQQIFVSRYLVALPSEAQLQRWLEEEREALAARFEVDR